jgi:hypothetical protein
MARGMASAAGDGLVAVARVAGALCRDATLPVLRDPAEQIGSHRCIANVAPGELDGADLQRFRVDAAVDQDQLQQACARAAWDRHAGARATRPCP